MCDSTCIAIYLLQLLITKCNIKAKDHRHLLKI